MGYYTKFSIATQPADQVRSVRDSIEYEIEYEIEYDPFDGEEVKWYEVAETLEAVSRKHPGAVITVRGEGQEVGDEWVIHAHDGQTEHHKRERWEPPLASEAMAAAARRFCWPGDGS